MSILNDLVPLVLDRIEESRVSPKFWNVEKEILVFLVEALNEAALITGEPQVRFIQSLVTGAPITLAANQTVFDITGDVPIFGMMRLESLGQVMKTSLWDLDRMIPGWENDVGAEIQHWFPIGLTQFGIHPQLEAPVNVFVSGVAQPVPSPRPYTGEEQMDFQEEYRDAFVDYAAHIAALKEGGKEFTDSIFVYNRFLKRAQELSKFATRKGSLRFTKTMGMVSKISSVEQR
jgi:hypothetical protein